MTRADLVWRLSGAALTIGGCTAGALHRPGSPWTLLYFLAALLGIVLMLNGKRVGVVVKAERRGHAHTSSIIHARRVQRLRAPRR